MDGGLREGGGMLLLSREEGRRPHRYRAEEVMEEEALLDRERREEELLSAGWSGSYLLRLRLMVSLTLPSTPNFPAFRSRFSESDKDVFFGFECFRSSLPNRSADGYPRGS
jgi:hypothetical protein